MRVLNFKEQNVVIAEDQPEYIPMPAHISDNGIVTCCWGLSWGERFEVLFRGKIWHQILTFQTLLQPQILQVNKPKDIV